MGRGGWRGLAGGSGIAVVLSMSVSMGSGCIVFPQDDLPFLEMEYGSPQSLRYAVGRRGSALIGHRISTAGVAVGWVQTGVGLFVAALAGLGGSSEGASAALAAAGGGLALAVTSMCLRSHYGRAYHYWNRTWLDQDAVRSRAPPVPR